MGDRAYYEAYDKRYKTVHEKGIRWFGDAGSAIVLETMAKYQVGKEGPILELGCGEGRDAQVLLEQGYGLLATDISEEAVRYCRTLLPAYEDHFQVLDCVRGALPRKFGFIYAVAVLHMLVLDADRDAFYRFIRDHLTPDGAALICTMGDGQTERQSDIHTAFDLQERPFGDGKLLMAGTSCRMVGDGNFAEELRRNGLQVLERGQTCIPEVFPEMMYAVVRRAPEGAENDDESAL